MNGLICHPSLGLGIIAGLTRDRLPDLLLSTISLIGMSLPEFVTATLLIYLFSIKLRLFPAVTLVNIDVPLSNCCPITDTGVLILALGFLFGVAVIRIARATTLDFVARDFVLAGLCHGGAAAHDHLPRIAAQCAGYSVGGGRAALVVDVARV